MTVQAISFHSVFVDSGKLLIVAFLVGFLLDRLCSGIGGSTFFRSILEDFLQWRVVPMTTGYSYWPVNLKESMTRIAFAHDCKMCVHM